MTVRAPRGSSRRTSTRKTEPRPRSRAELDGERLQKAIATLGLASRREAEVWIRAGRLTVNGRPATLGQRVRASDHIQLDGRAIRQRAPAAERQVFICHRSSGEALAGASATPERVSLTERLPRGAGRRFIAVSPMPRVDGGLELVTADGALAQQLQRSVQHLETAFSVRVRGELEEEQLARVREGALDSGETIAVLGLDAEGGEGSNRWYTLITRGASGKDVRQLFERTGALVSRILRTRLGNIALERSLARGQFRRLTAVELDTLLGTKSERSSDP
ncbi:MAG TPA: S4 domain-containing protein [Steroidobacteraceae bacterium]|nr:S4 domain-containing protein [Steroidobacteraceae bacterium]